MKEADIRRFIQAKADWIKRKQARVRNEALAPRQYQYVDGETFWYLGVEIPLRLVRNQKPALVMDGVFRLAKSAQPKAESVFTAWYRKQARRV